MKGKLIVLEGADDLGKSTQIDLLYNYLLDKKNKVIKTREPGSNKLGSRIREILLNTNEKIPNKAQLLLFQADRNIHYELILKPYLEQGYIILCDRFYLSTLVYQHKLNGATEEEVCDLNGFSTNYLAPDLTLVFHGKPISNEIKDAYEEHTVMKNHSKLNNYYIEYGKKLPNHILINANRDKKSVFNDLIKYIEEMI